MVTSCTFHGLVGIQNASRYQYDNKHYWKYDGYIALPDSDLAVAVFTFGANTASAEDGIYLMHGRTMIGSAVTDEGTSTHTLHIYANDELQPLEDGNRALPILIVVGKKNIRVHCYYLQGHPWLSKTPLPSASKHVVIQGTVLRIEQERCVLAVKDIAFGPADNVIAGPTSDVVSSTPSKAYDWSSKEKSKRGRGNDDEDDIIADSTSKAGSSKAARI
ncbi:hypothetical protein BDR07DRAFT_1480782 [Suillus spraguei]|nr:hypothetical protein BDR07DRAFT_1480782 [Suillus spraguei]